MPVDEIRKLINTVDNYRTQFNSPPFAPFISKKLRELVEIPELTKPVDKNEIIKLQQEIENKNKQTIDELKQMNDELKQQIKDELKDELKEQMKEQTNELKKDIQELLNSFIKIKNSNP